MFSLVKLFTGALAITSVAIAAVTPQQAVENIRALTTKSQALQAPAQSITLVDGALLPVGLGLYPVSTIVSEKHKAQGGANRAQQIITGFVDIVSTAIASFEQMQGTPNISNPADAQAVADAFREVRRTDPQIVSRLTDCI